jgi:hypothetical protein
LARNRHKSSRKRQKPDAAQRIGGQESGPATPPPASATPASGNASKRRIWIAAGVAAAIVLGAGLLYALYGTPAKPQQAPAIPPKL